MLCAFVKNFRQLKQPCIRRSYENKITLNLPLFSLCLPRLVYPVSTLYTQVLFINFATVQTAHFQNAPMCDDIIPTGLLPHLSVRED